MFESKISSAKSAWGQLSAINTSNAAGFIPISCPTHTQYTITNICKATNCIEPLCPQCIPEHVQLHQQTKKPAKIQNIITTRVKCIQQLAKMKYEAEKQLEESVKNSIGNIDEFVQSHQKKLDIAHQKIQKLVDEIFNKLQEHMEIIVNAFYSEKQKKQKQAILKMSPINEFIKRVKEYKQQLESEQYIPALIQILNQPPRKPKIEALTKIQNYGSVEIAQKYFEDIKANIEKFVKVNVNVKETDKVNIKNSNYYKSNNMKFSRLDQSRSRSKDVRDSSLNGNRMSNSRTKIFKGGQSIIGQLNPVTQNHYPSPTGHKNSRPQNILCNFINEEIPLKIIKSDYFTSGEEQKLITFKEGERYYFRANLNYIEAGFTKVNLNINFNIPHHSKTIILPSSQVLLLGGELDEKWQSGQQISHNVYQLVNQKQLVAIPSMKESRSNFGVCYHNSGIYVFGGLTNSNSYSKKQTTKGCQFFDLNQGGWKSLTPLQEGAYDFSICSVSDKIIKFGGRLESGQLLQKIDIFHIDRNNWSSIEPNPMFVMTVNPGICQISHDSLVIFGGQLPRLKQKVSGSYLVKINSDSTLTINPTKQLYNEASFESAYTYQNCIFAIQESESNRNKIIMGYRMGQWKFISC